MVVVKAIGQYLIMIIFIPPLHPLPHPPCPIWPLHPSNRAALPAPTLKKDRIHWAPQIHISRALAVHQHAIRGQGFVWQSGPARKPKGPSVYPSSEEVYFSISPRAPRYALLQESNQISQPVFSNLLLIKTAVILNVVRWRLLFCIVLIVSLWVSFVSCCVYVVCSHFCLFAFE